MFNEFAENDQTVQKQSVGKTTPRPEFPELRCSLHKSPVILVCTKPDCEKRIFLCSRCVTTELDHINKCNPLAVYDDFVRYIHEPSGLKVNPSEEAQIIAKAKNHNVSGFMNHINEQKYQVTQVINKLDDLYKNKCSELVSSLQQKLEDEKDIYSQNYSKFEKEVSADKERDCDMPKFHEIKDEVARLKDLEKIEEYMKTVLRKKQQWKEASIELRTLGKRSEDFYRELIESQQQNKPAFSQGEDIIQFWTNGLDKLIGDVKRRSQCFENMFSGPDGININISQINELGLLTNQMIKEDTELKISFSGVKFTPEQAVKSAKHIAVFSNLRHITLDFSQSQIVEDALNTFLEAVSTLSGLKFLNFSCEGSKNKNIAAVALAKVLPALSNLNELRLNFAFSDLHCAGAAALAEAVGQITNLKTLNLQFQYNHVREEGAKAWGQALEQLKNLENLFLSFGGFSNQKNKIKDEGATYIAKSLKFLPKLSTLHLDLGHTGFHNSFALEFALSLKELNLLSAINLQFYNNALTEKGGKKIAKCLAKQANLKTVTLNLNSNELKKDGVREVVDAFRRTDTIKNLSVYLRSTGISKDDGSNLQTDLTHGRNYDSCELFV